MNSGATYPTDERIPEQDPSNPEILNNLFDYALIQNMYIFGIISLGKNNFPPLLDTCLFLSFLNQVSMVLKSIQNLANNHSSQSKQIKSIKLLQKNSRN